MGFEHGATVTRERRRSVTDPYSAKPAPGDWTDPLTLTVEGAYIDTLGSSPATADPNRDTKTVQKTLYCDPNQDIRVGDRIRSAGHVYKVNAVPAADVNPFTGWQPPQEIPLTEVLG